MRPVPMAHTGSYAIRIRENSSAVNAPGPLWSCDSQMRSVWPAFAFGEGFADADDGSESRGQGGFGFFGYRFVGFAEELAAFGMADDDVAASGFGEHGGGNFSGEGAFFFPVDVLSGDGDFCVFGGFDGRGDGCVWRGYDDVAVTGFGGERRERGEKRAGVGGGFVHLPVAGNDAAPHDFAPSGREGFSVRASTPGSFRPPRNSRDAPPPVEMCEIFPATPDWWTAATESPPPTMEVAPRSVAAATAMAMSRVPLAKAGISKTPMGPFHTMVFALEISAAYKAMERGPMSRPIWSSGVASDVYGGGGGIGFELRGDDLVDREEEFEVFLVRVVENFLGKIQLFDFDKGFADGMALGFEEGVGHASADEHGVGNLHQVFDDFDFVADFGAAEDGYERARRIADGFAEVGQFPFHQEACGGLIYEMGDAHHRGMGAMGRAERIAHEQAVAESGELLGEGLVVFFFFRVEADIF